MKKVLFLTILYFVLSLTLMACSSRNESKTQESKTQESKTQESKTQESKTQESKTLADDYAIPITDKELLKRVRDYTGITSRDITYGDVKEIKDFYVYDCNNLSSMKYFTSLETFYAQGTFSDLNGLNNLVNLKSLEISSEEASLKDISALSELTNLQSLVIWGSKNISDISALKKLTNLQSLNIGDCKNLSDISALKKLINLQSLDIGGCNSISDLSDLKKLINLQSLDIGSCEKLSDISALSNLTNLQSLYIDSCENRLDFSALKNLTNLESWDIYDCDNINSTQIRELEKGSFTKLKDYIINNGSCEDDRYTLILDNTIKNARGAYYDAIDDTITLMYVLDFNYAVAILIDAIDGVYDWAFFDGYNTINGEIDATTYNSKSLLSYSDTDITDSSDLTDILELASTMVDDLCDYMNSDFRSIEVTAVDLGFLNY